MTATSTERCTRALIVLSALFVSDAAIADTLPEDGGDTAIQTETGSAPESLPVDDVSTRTQTENEPGQPDMLVNESLSDIEVTAPALDDNLLIDPLRSNTRIGKQELERRQSSDIFDVLQDTAGVNISGGPLSNGKTITIRGFQDSEDVLLKLDGALKDFEKYRFGGGPFIDPELLRSIDVQRGSGASFVGSGALGGAVVMETVDAIDLLQPGERIGGKIKFSHNTNNDENAAAVSTYAAPTDWLDLLVNASHRRSHDITLGDRTRLENSSSPSDSVLGKFTLIPSDDLTLGWTYTRYKAETLEPFDATTGLAPTGTYVRRRVDDKTSIIKLKYNPLSDWVDLKASWGRVNTLVDDTGTDAISLPPLGTTLRFLFDLRTFELDNTSRFSIGPIDSTFRYGVQWHSNERRSLRIQDGVESEYFLQPPGLKKYWALILENTFEWGDFTFIPAVRRDFYTVKAMGQAADTLTAEMRDTRIDFIETSPSVSLAYRVLGGPVSVFYNASKSFRPPLIDEYYSSVFATCNPFLLASGTPWFNFPLPADTPGFFSGLCGDLYEPETATNQEIGFSADLYDLADEQDWLSMKVVLYRTDVENVLETMSLISPTRLGQPGEEHRHGLELEINYTLPQGFARVSYSKTRGKLECPAWAPGDGSELTLPADSIDFSVGIRHWEGKLEYGYRGKKVMDREVIEEGFVVAGVNPCKAPYPTETASGYSVHNLFLSWKPLAGMDVRLNIDNLTNREYETENLESAGTPAPGRTFRLTLSQSF